jgi:hypothetical protein
MDVSMLVGRQTFRRLGSNSGNLVGALIVTLLSIALSPTQSLAAPSHEHETVTSAAKTAILREYAEISKTLEVGDYNMLMDIYGYARVSLPGSKRFPGVFPSKESPKVFVGECLAGVGEYHQVGFRTISYHQFQSIRIDGSTATVDGEWNILYLPIEGADPSQVLSAPSQYLVDSMLFQDTWQLEKGSWTLTATKLLKTNKSVPFTYVKD